MDHPAEQSFQEPTDKKTRAGYGKFLRPNTPYDNFMESQGIPIYRDIGVRRVQDLPRKPWKRMGGTGTFIQLLGTEGLWGCYVVEVPAVPHSPHGTRLSLLQAAQLYRDSDRGL